MNEVIIEFTYKGRKHTYLRRIGIYGDVVTTTNINSAKKLKKRHVENAIKTIILKLGKDNVGHIKTIKG